MFSFPFGSLSSVTAVTALTNMTLRFILKHPSSISGGDLWSVPETGDNDYGPLISYGTNVILIQTTADRHEDPYIWSIPVTANALDDIAIAWDPSSSTTPVVYKNGTAQTVTLVSTGSTDPVSMGTEIWTLGGGSSSIGYMGGFAWWSDQLSAANLEKLTKARIYNMPLYISNSTLVQLVPMDDFPVGEYIAITNTCVPNADVATPWGTATPHWSKVNADDGTYINAGKSDDNETETFDMTTFTIPTGFSVYASTMGVWGNIDDDDSGSAYVTKNGVNLTTWGMGLTSSEGITLNTEYSSWTQTDVDGARVSLVTPSMSKDDGINIDQVYLKFSYRRHAVVNLKGSVEFRNIGGLVKSEGLVMSGGY